MYPPEALEVSGLTLWSADSFRRFRWSRVAMREDAPSLLRYRVYLIAAGARKAPAVMYFLVARLEQAFAGFAKVPYNDARTRRETEQMLDDLDGNPRVSRSQQPY